MVDKLSYLLEYVSRESYDMNRDCASIHLFVAELDEASERLQTVLHDLLVAVE